MSLNTVNVLTDLQLCSNPENRHLYLSLSFRWPSYLVKNTARCPAKSSHPCLGTVLFCSALQGLLQPD